MRINGLREKKRRLDGLLKREPRLGSLL